MLDVVLENVHSWLSGHATSAFNVDDPLHNTCTWKLEAKKAWANIAMNQSKSLYQGKNFDKNKLLLK